MERIALLEMTVGATFMFGFGIVWLLVGLFLGRPSAAWLQVSLLCFGVILGAAIATLGVRASKLPSNAIPLTPQQIEINGRVMQHFYIIFGIEIAAILLAVVALKAIQYPDFILSGVALIVAVHFFPLAALFHAPVYYVTALCGSAIGLAGFFMADAVLRQKMVGLSFGLLLWATAAWVTWLGFNGAAAGGSL